MSVRAFLALPIDEGTRNTLAAFLEQLRDVAPECKPTRTENLHVTLAFLGNISEESIPMICDSIDVSARLVPAFQCHIRGVGAFGPPRTPRVFWARVEEGRDSCSTLFENLKDRLLSIGISLEDRPYVPHITLARRRSGENPARLLELLKEAGEKEFGTYPVSSVLFYQSTLSPHGPSYTVLHESPLPSR